MLFLLPFPEVYQDILHKYTPTLVTDLELEKLKHHLLHLNIIDENDEAKIRWRKTRKGMNEALLTTLTEPVNKAVRTLVEGLQEYQPSLACMHAFARRYVPPVERPNALICRYR